jgi:hypothetical protein
MAVKELERPREALRENRRKAGPEPTEPRPRVYVTPSGRVVIGDDVHDGEEHLLSEVHRAVFA